MRRSARGSPHADPEQSRRKQGAREHRYAKQRACERHAAVHAWLPARDAAAYLQRLMQRPGFIRADEQGEPLQLPGME